MSCFLVSRLNQSAAISVFYTRSVLCEPKAKANVILFLLGDETSEQFVGNATAPDHFRILDKDDFSIIVGGR